MKKTRDRIIKNINSIVVTLLISLNILAVIISLFNIFQSNISLLIVFFSYSLFLISILLRGSITFNRKIIFLLIFIIFVFGFSYFRLSINDSTTDLLVNFLVFGIISLLISSSNFSIRKVFDNITYVSLLAFVFLSFYLNIYTNDTDFIRIEMGLSYALLPLFVGTALHFIFFRKNANILNKIAYLLNLYFLYLLLFFGTRGVVISIFLLLVLLVSLKINDSKIQVSAFKIILISFVIFFLFINLQQILELAQQISAKFSVNIAFIEKTLDLISSEGDLFNSRLSIYKIAIEGFLKKPLFGNGIGSFNFNTGIVYVHNIFLDLLYDGGLFLFIPITLVLSGIFKSVFMPSNLNRNYYIFLLFLFINSIPRLMFSASFWSVQIFWLLIGFYISKSNREIE